MDKTKETLIGDNIKKKRESIGMTQTELASRTGITVTSISRIEQGHTHPRRANLKLIASVLGCKIDDFYEIEVRSEVDPHSYSEAAEFLSRFEGLSVDRKALVLWVVFQDKRKLEHLRNQLSATQLKGILTLSKAL